MTFFGADLSLVTRPTPAQQPASDAGTSSRTAAMTPRTAAAAALHQLPIPLGDGDEEMAQHRQQLSSIAAASAVVLRGVRGGSPAAGGASRLAELCGQALPHVVALAEYEVARAAEAAKNASDAEGMNPFKSIDAEEAQGKTAEGAQAHGWHLENARESLDKLAMAVREVGRAAGPGPDGKRALGALELLRLAAPPLQWKPAADLDGAKAQVRAHQSCASDPADGVDPREDNPDHCYLPDSIRDRRQAELARALVNLRSKFSTAIKKYRAPIQAMIEHDRKVDEEIGGAVVDALVEAATAGVGKVALPAIHGAAAAGAEAVAEAAKAEAKSVIEAAREVALDVVKSAAKDAVRTTLKHPDLASPDDEAPEIDPRQKTLAEADSLDGAIEGSTEQLIHDVTKLDDATLEILTSMIQSVTVAEITERLDPIMQAFREQIEPLGERKVGPGFPSLRQTVKRAVRVQLPNDLPPRYALVDYTSDTNPAPRVGQRAVVAGAKDHLRRARGGRLFDDADRAADRAWIATPDVEIEFVRWIENPAEGGPDLESMVAADALDVPADRVRKLPHLADAGAVAP